MISIVLDLTWCIPKEIQIPHCRNDCSLYPCSPVHFKHWILLPCRIRSSASFQTKRVNSTRASLMKTATVVFIRYVDRQSTPIDLCGKWSYLSHQRLHTYSLWFGTKDADAFVEHLSRNWSLKFRDDEDHCTGMDEDY